MKSFGTQRFRFAVVNTGLTPFTPWNRMALAMLNRDLFIGWWSETGLALSTCAMRSRFRLLQLFRSQNIAKPCP